jgi:hypothetical protein
MTLTLLDELTEKAIELAKMVDYADSAERNIINDDEQIRACLYGDDSNLEHYVRGLLYSRASLIEYKKNIKKLTRELERMERKYKREHESMG